MVYLGLFFSLLIGVVLGLVGGGGSILTVPLVNYFFGTSMLLATTYSLFVVAVASGIGVVQRLKTDQIDFRKGVIFVIPSMLTAFAIRGFVMPLFPINLTINNWVLSRDLLITVLLVIVMMYTAIRTLVSKGKSEVGQTRIIVIIVLGVFTGILSGFIGAGGGFIIVPILMRMGLDMKKAVGTSMFIISIQSFVALLGDFFNKEIMTSGEFDWKLLVLITLITVAGVFIGTYLQKRISSKYLRKIFSIVLIGVSIGLLWKL